MGNMITYPKDKYDVLYLTYPEIIQRFDRDQISGPSRFLEEIEKEKVFEEVELEEEKG